MFISFEGIDGSGKSTQARLLADRLRALGHETVLTREPGGSDGAEQIRALLVEGGHATDEDLKVIDKEIKAIVNDSAEFSKESPEPALSELWTDIYA